MYCNHSATAPCAASPAPPSVLALEVSNRCCLRYPHPKYHERKASTSPGRTGHLLSSVPTTVCCLGDAKHAQPSSDVAPQPQPTCAPCVCRPRATSSSPDSKLLADTRLTSTSEPQTPNGENAMHTGRWQTPAPAPHPREAGAPTFRQLKDAPRVRTEVRTAPFQRTARRPFIWF